jgi:uncharacterized membrane protein
VPQSDAPETPQSWKENPYVQIESGFFAGLALGIVPFGGAAHQVLDETKVISHGRPLMNRGLAVGQIVGGIFTMVGGVTGEVLGGAASVTGIGAAIGVPAMVVSTTLVVGGAANVAAGTTTVLCVDEQGQSSGKAVSAKSLAKGLPESAFERITWRQGSKERLSARFVFVRVRVPAEKLDGQAGPGQWLIVEWRDDDKAPEHFALTTLGVDGSMSKEEIVRLFKERYRTEQLYSELKGELGLDHFEGRSFIGWHHHVTVVLCCYAFVVAERALHGLPSTPTKPQGLSDPRPLLLAA